MEDIERSGCLKMQNLMKLLKECNPVSPDKASQSTKRM
jgi:hypothetical protein